MPKLLTIIHVNDVTKLYKVTTKGIRNKIIVNSTSQRNALRSSPKHLISSVILLGLKRWYDNMKT